MIYNNQPYVNAVSLKIADQILAEYYGLLEYRGLLWIIVEYYWIIGLLWNIIGFLEYFGILWNIMDYCPICTPKS
jgi:hypothetical protein